MPAPPATPTTPPTPAKLGPVRFRRNPAAAAAAMVMVIIGLSVAAWAPYLLGLLVVPAAIAVWLLRTGTDADRAGLTIKAGLGKHAVPWSDIAEIRADPRGRVLAQLDSGAVLTLPAVTPHDLGRLLAITSARED